MVTHPNGHVVLSSRRTMNDDFHGNLLPASNSSGSLGSASI
jgi:hypothetical protein